MTVTLIAHTVLTDEAYDVLPRDLEWNEGTALWDPATVAPSDHLAEIAGRECYQSWSRPNPATAANADYLANVIAKQHTSVLAHASFTFRLTDVSRSLTHELIRHRFLAVSELSQRYVNMDQSYTVVPPLFQDNPGAYVLIEAAHRDLIEDYNSLVQSAIANGATRKQAREAARCVLPGGTNTAMIVSGNTRAWRDFVIQRNSAHADAEIREVAGEILAVLREYAPNSVQDIPDEPST